jgi:glycerol uptake facilitator-like aquaporin
MQKQIGEFVGTASLALVVVGSGQMAEILSRDIGIQLLINATATGVALWLLITLFAPISGAHFNPVISIIAYIRREISLQIAVLFITLQVVGAIVGTAIANILFEHPAIYISSKNRDGGHLLLSEVVATAGLVFTIYQLSTIKKGRFIPAGVASWIFAAYFFTSSTAFANPAISIGRIFSDSFAGVAPHSAAAFIPFQIMGAALGYLLVTTLNKKAKKS